MNFDDEYATERQKRKLLNKYARQMTMEVSQMFFLTSKKKHFQKNIFSFFSSKFCFFVIFHVFSLSFIKILGIANGEQAVAVAADFSLRSSGCRCNPCRFKSKDKQSVLFSRFVYQYAIDLMKL